MELGGEGGRGREVRGGRGGTEGGAGREELGGESGKGGREERGGKEGAGREGRGGRGRVPTNSLTILFSKQTGGGGSQILKLSSRGGGLLLYSANLSYIIADTSCSTNISILSILSTPTTLYTQLPTI